MIFQNLPSSLKARGKPLLSSGQLIENLYSLFSLMFTVWAVLFLNIDSCYAVPDAIGAVRSVLNPIVAYGPFVFTAGGIYYSAVNGRHVINGDYRRVVPGVISILATTLGLTGLFGEGVLTVLVP